MKTLLTLALAAPLLAGCAAQAMDTGDESALSERDQRRMAAMIGDREAGEPETCIQLRPTTQSTIIGNRAVLYRNGATVYYNDFRGLCPTLRSSATIVTSTPSNRLCSGDIAQIVDTNSRISFGSCAFGEWIPYRRPGDSDG